MTIFKTTIAVFIGLFLAALTPPLQENDLLTLLLDRYGLPSLLILIGLGFLLKYWWPQHVKERNERQAIEAREAERQQERADLESKERIEQDKAQTSALQEMAIALQNVQKLQEKESDNLVAIGKAIQETAVYAKVSADVMAGQLQYLQELNSPKKGET